MFSLNFLRRSRFELKLLAALVILVVLLVGTISPAFASRPSPLLYPQSDWVSIGAGQSGTLVWSCSSDRYNLGAGFETEAVSGNSARGFTMIHSHPRDYNTWELRLHNTDDIARRVKIYSVCAKTSDF